MKLHFRILSVLLILCMSFPLIATSEEIPESSIPNSVDQTKLVELLLEVALTAGGVEYEIDGNNTGFVVHIVDEDMSEALFMNGIFGTDESDAVVADMVQSTVDWLSGIYTDMLDLCIDDPNVLFLWVHSFDEPDFIYLAVCNGKLIYDWNASQWDE